MFYGLTRDERRGFERDGFFVREAVLGADSLDPLRKAVDDVHERILREAERSPAPVGYVDGKAYQELLGSSVKWEWDASLGRVRSMEPFVYLDARFSALLEDDRLWGAACELVGVDALGLFTDKLNFKCPGGSPFPWHQDGPYWDLHAPKPDCVASLQLYLDDATMENGCLWLVPGSHRGGTLPGDPARGILGRLCVDPAALDVEVARPIIAPAGSLIYFHRDVVHGSRSNRSGLPRRSIVLTGQQCGRPRWNPSTR